MNEDEPTGENGSSVAVREGGQTDTPPADVRAIHQAIKSSAVQLSRAANVDDTIVRTLADFGDALNADQIRLYQNNTASDWQIETTQRYRWAAATASAQEGSQPTFSLKAGEPDSRTARLSRGEAVQVDALADDHIGQALTANGSAAALFVPIFVDGKWWGEIEIDRCRLGKSWSQDEIDGCIILGMLIGAAILRAGANKELADASRIIENSATILFRFSAEKPYPINYLSNNVRRYGYTGAHVLASPLRYLELIHPDDLPQALEDIGRVANGAVNDTSRDIRLRAADGRYLWFEVRMAAVRDKSGRIVEIEGLAIDIDRRKTTESYVVRFRLTDQLTGLPNRGAFMDELRHAFAAAKRGAHPFAILYIDLDQFKDVNEVLGHSKGDALLKLVALRLQGAIRTGDIVARFGGDEFAILQLDITDPSDSGALAARVLRDLSEPAYDLGTQVDATASIGISFFDPNISEPEDMIKQADMALYRAKDKGRNQYHFHSEALDIAIIERITLAGDLRRGLERGEIELYYQPQVDVETDQIVGAEALARWNHPKLGLLLPNHFVPIAERTGTIIPLGRWAIDQVCRQLIAWRKAGLSPPRISLNVSAVQIKATPDFDVDLMQTLQNWNIAASAIELELTESVLMATTRENRDIIDRLSRLGISIAIDDFGTGYSSLGYLRAYRVSHIKIAQEFVHSIEEGSGDIVIVRAAISLARELGITVIAEGVETAYQLKLLKEAGCRYVQGFYFSPPLPSGEMTTFLRRAATTTKTSEQSRDKLSPSQHT